MNNYSRSTYQFGLRSILVVVAVLSFCLALSVQGHLGTVMFLACMPLWAWTCLYVAMGCIVVLSDVLDRMHGRR